MAKLSKRTRAIREKVEAGASFIVTGTVVENTNDFSLLAKFAAAIHGV